jgi:hypothetical protein
MRIFTIMSGESREIQAVREELFTLSACAEFLCDTAPPDLGKRWEHLRAAALILDLVLERHASKQTDFDS